MWSWFSGNLVPQAPQAPKPQRCSGTSDSATVDLGKTLVLDGVGASQVLKTMDGGFLSHGGTLNQTFLDGILPYKPTILGIHLWNPPFRVPSFTSFNLLVVNGLRFTCGSRVDLCGILKRDHDPVFHIGFPC